MQSDLDILARVREESQWQSYRGECCGADLIQRDVIHLCLTVRAAALILKEQQDVGTIGAEDRVTVTTDALHRVALAR